MLPSAGDLPASKWRDATHPRGSICARVQYPGESFRVARSSDWSGLSTLLYFTPCWSRLKAGESPFYSTIFPRLDQSWILQKLPGPPCTMAEPGMLENTALSPPSLSSVSKSLASPVGGRWGGALVGVRVSALCTLLPVPQQGPTQ